MKTAGVELPNMEDLYMKAPIRYLGNRDNYLSYINNKLKERFGNIDDNITLSCNADAEKKFGLLVHQKIIKYYLNIFNPYRGLLLYHGLGAGKTCGSIGIAEGLKTYKQVLVMVPASLRMNYIQELKKCGDPFYKRGQKWEFIPENAIQQPVSDKLALPPAFVRKQKGVWFPNPTKGNNYDDLDSNQKLLLDNQINQMIQQKYSFINYNGMRNKNLDDMSDGGKINIFDNKVVIIDEAHNFISRIVNKLKQAKKT